MKQPFEYYRPSTREEALKLLARQGYVTAPLIVQPKPIALRQMGVDALVDLELLDLDYIRETKDGTVQIGAMATLQEMVDSPVLHVGALEILCCAARLAATPGIRNLSGLWGAMQAHSGPPEVILAFLALDAQVVLLGPGEKQRRYSFQEFYDLNVNEIQRGELVMEAILPAQMTDCGWGLERVARTLRDEAIVAAAAIIEIETGKASRVMISLAGANPHPCRLSSVETFLLGKAFDAQTLQVATRAIEDQADPTGDFRGSREYRRSMSGLVVARALKKAWERATDQED